MEGSQIIIISLSSSVSRSRQGPRWYCPRPLALAVSLVQLHLELGQGAGAEENCHFFFFLLLFFKCIPGQVGSQRGCPVTRTASGVGR